MSKIEEQLSEIHQCIFDPDMGIKKILMDTHDILNGKPGIMGLRTKVWLLWIATGGAWSILTCIIIYKAIH